MIKKQGFTLAEVLITLVILGVIAAMTIPNIIGHYREQATVSKLKKAHTILGQAFQMAKAEYGTPDNWGLRASDAKSLSDIFVKYLRVAKYCGSEEDGCKPDVYMQLNNSRQTYLSAHSNNLTTMVLDDGTIWTFGLKVNGESCSANFGSGLLANVCGSIGVDINGFAPPNTVGRDFFWFYVTKEGIVPHGVPDDTVYPVSTCNSSGVGCAAWVLYKENMDYLKGKTLSW